MNLGAVVLADTAMWAGWSVTVGYAASRMPVDWLSCDHWVTRLRPWEQGGRRYEQFGVRRWKDRLPEAGAFFGGISKRTLPRHDRVGLSRFAADTRRAELVHWAIPAALPVFALWNPPALLAAMAAYALVANAPCVIVQRYNRGRIERLLASTRTST